MSIEAPPIRNPLIDDEGFANLAWILFFNSLFEGDTGTTWTPTFVNLTQTGTPTITGRYYRLSRRIVYFAITVTPATNTSAVAGTTYIDNFPLTFSGDGVSFAVSGNLGAGPGHVVASGNRIYVPSWTAVTVPLTVVGMCEVRS